MERAGRRIHPKAACQAAFQRGRSTCRRRNSPRAHPRPAGIGTGWLCPKRASLRAGCVQTEAGCKGWSCPKRAAEKPAVSKKGQLKSRLCPNSISRSRHKEASAFFFLPSCISPASFCIFARKRLSFFVIFFGIFYVFLSWKDIQFSGVIFFAKKSRFSRLKISAY